MIFLQLFATMFHVLTLICLFCSHLLVRWRWTILPSLVITGFFLSSQYLRPLPLFFCLKQSFTQAFTPCCVCVCCVGVLHKLVPCLLVERLRVGGEHKAKYLGNRVAWYNQFKSKTTIDARFRLSDTIQLYSSPILLTHTVHSRTFNWTL